MPATSSLNPLEQHARNFSRLVVARNRIISHLFLRQQRGNLFGACQTTDRRAEGWLLLFKNKSASRVGDAHKFQPTENQRAFNGAVECSLRSEPQKLQESQFL